MRFVLSALALSLSAQSSVPSLPPGSCAQALVSGLSSTTAELCLGEEQARQADASKDARERSRLWSLAAQHYRNAVTAAGDPAAKARALNALAEIYDAKHLQALDQVEQVLRELIATQPGELAPVFRLAAVQEDQNLVAAAEDTLQAVHREHPDAIEPYMMLAQFYSRRALAIRQTTDPPKPRDTAAQGGQRDENGVYTIGGGIPAPRRVGTPQYPPDAMAAGIQGVVIAEIVVNESGDVSDAKVIRSVPLLDEAALNAVRTWKYSPTLVNGQPVPVKMTVTVNFSQTPPAAPRAPSSPR